MYKDGSFAIKNSERGTGMNGTIGVSGALTAMVTPFKADGSLDLKGLEQNIEFQISQGISGLVPVGTTGESPTLTPEEHELVIRHIGRHACGRTYLLGGAGSNNTDEALYYTRIVQEAGYDGVLIVDPYYNGPSSLEIYQHYKEIAETFPELTIVPYIIPGRTGCELSIADLIKLAWNMPNVRAVKEATGKDPVKNFDRMKETRQFTPDMFSIFSGDDNLTFEMMTDPEILAEGVISVTSNLCPGAVQLLCASIRAGNLVNANSLQQALAPLFELVTVFAHRTVEISEVSCYKSVKDKFRNPDGIKTMMSGLGMPSGLGRKPLRKMTKPAVNSVRDALRQVWGNNPELLMPIQEFYEVDIAQRLADDSIWDALTYKG